jgi:spermidine synthase
MRRQTIAIHALFFLSGAGALVLESVWFSQAGLLLGNAVWSAALVTGAFMAGLALGNAAALPLSRRWRSPVRAYAAVEAIAALSGAALVLGLPFLPALFRPLLSPLLEDPAALNAARLAIAFGLLVIPAVALGASLPLLAGPLEGLSGNYGLALGRLYGINTLGALAGTLAAELVLIPALGLRGSGLAGAACNMAAAVLAWRLAPTIQPPAPPAYAGVRSPLVRGASQVRTLVAAFLAGALLLALEVVWFRFLLLFRDGTTLVFALMLAVVLAGIGLGALIAARLSRRGPFAGGAARVCCAAAAAWLVASYAAFDAVLRLAAPIERMPLASVLALSLFLMAPVALASGALFTALGNELRGRLGDAASATGALTAANTAGAVLGSLAAAFVLLPLAGMERSFFLLALLYGVAVLVIPASPQGRLLRFAPALVAAAAVALFPFGRMAGALAREVEAHFAGRIVASREGIAETAFYLAHDFLGEPLFHRLATNSYSMASTAVGAQRYMKLFTYLPAALHPRIESAALLCFGVGATASALTDLPELRTLDVVDVSRDILEMSDVVHPDPRRHPLRDPRVAVHLEDARFFLQHTAKRYDLITGEPPPPKIAGMAALYTREHFAAMRERLNPGGIATYWLPAHLLHEHEALAIAHAFCDAFADCSLWSGVNLDWILLGSRDGLAPAPRERFARLWALPGAGPELRRLGFDSPGELAAQFMADAGTLRELAAAAAPLIDDFPRRVGPQVSAQPATPRYVELMSAARGRERLAASAWAARLLPPELIAESRDGFRRREILEAAIYPALRRPGYDYWDDMAELLRAGSAELPRWALGSGARAAQIAARAGPADPLAAEHIAIDALASRRRPQAPSRERFAAMTVRGQVVTLFHHCIAGERARAAQMAGWIARERREEEPYRSFLAWTARHCT